MLTAVDLFKKYHLLAGDEKDLVDLLAIAYTPLPVFLLDIALARLGAKKTFNALSKPLVRDGLINAGNRFSGFYGENYFQGQGAAICAPAVVELVARELAASGRFAALANAVTTVAPNPKPFMARYQFESVGQLLRSVRMAFHQGDFERVAEVFDALARPGAVWVPYRESYRWLDRAGFYCVVCANPFDREWFLRLPAEVVDLTIPRLLEAGLGSWEAPDAEVGRVLVNGCEGRLGRQVPPAWFFELARWRWLEGDFAACARILRSLTGSGLEGCLALLTEGVDAAIASFDEVLASIGLIQGKGKGKPVLPGAIGAIHLLALWLRNTDADGRKAALLLKQWLKRHPGGLLHMTLSLVPGLLVHDPIARGELARTFAYNESTWKSDPLGFTLAYLLAAWLDRETALKWAGVARACADLAASRGMAWPAAELAAMLARLQPGRSGASSAADDFEREHGVTLLGRRLVLLEPWERALQSLIALGTPEQADTGPTPDRKDTRLVWLVSDRPDYDSPLPYSLEVREQKQRGKGWLKGKRVAPETLTEWSAEGRDMLLEQDHLVARHVSVDRSRFRQIFKQGAWLALVGHPHLLWADSFLPLDLVAGKLELRVTKLRGEAVQITLEPDFTDDQEIALWSDAPNRIHVAEINAAHRRIQKALGEDGLVVPLSARDKVVEALGAVAALVTVSSDIGGASGSSTLVPADGAPRMHLSPDGSGLAVEMLVRPFGEAGPYCTPGEGGKALFIEAEGKRLHTERDLAGERNKAESLVAACATLATAESRDDFAWQIPQPEECLELLLELQAMPDPVRVEWPSGESLKLAGKADFRRLKMRVSGSGDSWFAVDGELTISEDLVLDMRQLLALLGRRRGRFVQLDDGRYVALTEAFRRRLEDLDALAEVHGKARRVHVLAAPLLEDLAAEAGEFQSDKAWRQRLSRLRKAEALQPEVPANLEAELRDYQVEGYRWLARLANWGVGACLADDMGLGKTIQALAILLARGREGPALVIAPTSVCANWLDEARRFAPALRVNVLGAQGREAAVEELGAMDVLVCSYGLLQQPDVGTLLASRTWQTVVLDEAQAIKNQATRRSQAAMNLRGEFKLITTGTPVENHLGELWNLFRFINPGLLGSLESFNRRFAGPIERGDKDARSRLKRLVQPFILRRLKAQVLDELPARTDIQLDVELSDAERAFYEALRREVVADLEASQATPGEKQMKILAALMRLRRACCHSSLVTPDLDLPGSKLAVFGELIEELLDNNHKALVFSQFVDHLSLIRKWLDASGIAYQYLDGQTPAAERKKRVDAFQAGTGAVFLISLKAGGLGLNLTAADYVIHMDPWWNPAVEDQASDRAHRIGQSRPVTVYRLVAKETIEEKIVALHRRKRDLADGVLAGTETASKISTEELLRLIRET